MARNFAANLIDAYNSGIQARRNRLQYKREERQEAEDAEDRDIEKQVLQHQLKTMKLQDALFERARAKENLEILSGLPESRFRKAMDADVTGPMASTPIPGQVPPEGMVPIRRPTVRIPGLPAELTGGQGVPDIDVEPMTQEEELEGELAKIIQRQMYTPRELSYGERLYVPGQGYVAEGLPRPPSGAGGLGGRIINERDEKGVVTPRFFSNEQIRGGAELPTQQPVPRAGGAGGGRTLSPEQRSSIANLILAGKFPVDQIPKSTEGLLLAAELADAGMDVVKAGNELRAVRAQIGALNSDEIVKLQTDAEAAVTMLDELDALSKKYGSSGYGALSMLKALEGDEQSQARQRAESLVEAVKPLLISLRRYGSSATNAQLDKLDEQLNLGRSVGAYSTSIGAFKDAIKYRLNAIQSARIAVPGVTPQGGGTTTPAAPAPKKKLVLKDGQWVVPE